MNIGTVPPARAREFWPHIERHVAKALQYGRVKPEDVLPLIETEQARCWFALDSDTVMGVWLGSVERGDEAITCVVWAVGGDKEHEWAHLVPESVETWAKSVGCNEVQVVGRKKWVRRLPEYKWTAVVLRKEL